jgi:hypothetical protein
MEMEEKWLEEVASSMMEVKEPTVIKETRKMVGDEMDMNINIYQEMEYTMCLESQYEYLNHHGRVQTPLLGPATITEKGVEQGQVIGVSFSEGNDCDEAEVMEESMVGLESQNVYLNQW